MAFSFLQWYIWFYPLHPLYLSLDLYQKKTSTQTSNTRAHHQQPQTIITSPRTKSKRHRECQPEEQHTNDYTVSFLSPTQHTRGWGDVYSGMWWQSINTMLQTNYSRVSYLEQVTFLSFRNAAKVMQTADWLDLSVEHLSKYARHFHNNWGGNSSEQSGNDVIGNAMLKRLEAILLRYIDKAKQHYCHHVSVSTSSNDTQSPIESTIAILPIRITSTMVECQSRLSMLQLSATIASLWNVGVSRVVVAGIDDNEREVAQKAFELLKEHLLIRFMELEYVPMGHEEEKLIPKVAMVHFQKAIREYKRIIKGQSGEAIISTTSSQHNNKSLASLWLGADPSRWKYIYFSEPDLLLHIRSEAIPSLSIELQKGHLLNAHRLQPLPHFQQFMDIYDNAVATNRTSDVRKMESQLIPNLANFAAIHNLNISTKDTCCDQGMFYPANVNSPNNPLAIRQTGLCSTEWAFCGFSCYGGNYSDWSNVLEEHKLLLSYPFISLSKGTGLPLVHHGQRVCVPHMKAPCGRGRHNQSL